MSKADRDDAINKAVRAKFPLPQGMLRTHENCKAYYGVARPGKTYRKRLKQGSVTPQ